MDDFPDLDSLDSTTWINVGPAETPSGWEEEGDDHNGSTEWTPAIAVYREPNESGRGAGLHTWWVKLDRRNGGDGPYCYAEGEAATVELARRAAHSTAVAFRGVMCL